MPKQSATSAEMSARTVSIPLDEYGLTSELPAVHFAFNSATIRSEDRRILDANAACLKANTDQPVALGGAADPRGTKDYNLVLGQRRANAVKSYLVARGVAPDRIAVLSTGEFQQACWDKACWSLDRRVDFLVKKLPRQAP
jgi:peptidoglycan-associated lipoprotein